MGEMGRTRLSPPFTTKGRYVMSYEVRYTGSMPECARKCFKDVRNYLGEDLFVKVVNEIRDLRDEPVRNVRFMLGFVGLQGLAANVLIAYAWRGKGCLMNWQR